MTNAIKLVPDADPNAELTEEEKRAIYAAGKQAYNSGLTARHNPYRLGTDKFHFWCSGYWAMSSIGYDDQAQS